MEDQKEPDIKLFINFINENLKLIQESLNENSQNLLTISDQLKCLEASTEDSIVNSANTVLDKLDETKKDFKKKSTEEKQENSIIKQNLAKLNQEKLVIEQNNLLLGNRVHEIEKTVGTDLRLPQIDYSLVQELLKTNSIN